jgi:hypothetical protein
MPPFLTIQDFDNGTLKYTLDPNKHAVYALTITVPNTTQVELILSNPMGIHRKLSES